MTTAALSSRPDLPGATVPDARLPLPWLSWLVVLAGLGATFVWNARRYGSWLVDDGLITLAYARTLALGGGLAQAPGDPAVEGISNPTWTLLLAGLRRLGVWDAGRQWFGVEDYVACVKTLGLLLFLLSVVVIGRLARLVVGPRPALLAAAVAGFVLAFSPPYLVWAISGLENPLYAFVLLVLATVIATAIHRGRLLSARVAVLSSLLALVAAGTRPDGAIYAAAYPVCALLFWRPRSVGAGGRAGNLARVIGCCLVATLAFVLPAGGLLLWRHSVFGQWVPNTAVAKRQHGIAPDAFGRFPELVAASGTVIAGFAAVLLLAVLLTVLIRRLHRRPSDQPIADRIGLAPLLPVLVMFAFGALAYVVLNPDWMGEYRFATPAATMGAVLIGSGVAVLIRVWGRRWAKVSALVLTAVVLVGFVLQMNVRNAAFAEKAPVPGCYVANRFGRAINEMGVLVGVRSGSLLLPDIGGTLLTTNYRVIDLAGLTDVTIAKARGVRDRAAVRDYVLETAKPTLVHINKPFDAGLAGDARFRRDYIWISAYGDYVRRDAVPAGVDVAAMRARADALVVEGTRSRDDDPTNSCGPLRNGQTELISVPVRVP